MPTSFQDILLSFEFVGNSVGEHQAMLCRRTGKIYWRSEFSDLDEFNDELPDDIEDWGLVASANSPDMQPGSKIRAG